MKPNSFHLLLSLLVLVLLLTISTPLSSARPPSHRHRISIPSNVARRKTDKLIKSLNLFPVEPVNVRVDKAIDEASSIPVGKIVEKRFQFPNILAATTEELGHHAGYYKLPAYTDAKMFYFFFESRSNKSDPVVVWLTGGPGCGSELAMFYENGPFKVTDDLTLVPNEYGWDMASNILFIDQPVGTGFSYVSDEDQIPQNETGVSNDLYDFLQAFFKEHPDYVTNDFYITGESYAGHYIPPFAARVLQGNKAKEGTHVNLKGFAIGNGFTNPPIQYTTYTDYALQMKLIDEETYATINKQIPPCQEAIRTCESDGGDECAEAYRTCEDIFESILSATDNINYYDIRKKCVGALCYDYSNAEKYLRQKSVKEALGVGGIDFVSCSEVVYDAMMNDMILNLEVDIPTLLEDGIRMLVYAGEYDLICNWLGNVKWVDDMDWFGKKEFVASRNVSYAVGGSEAGQLRSHGPLTLLKVHNAGHMVPMDQPNVSLQMLKDWMQGKLTTK